MRTSGESKEGRESYREVLHRLSGSQKSGKGAPAYSRYINRRLGRMFAAAAYLIGLQPNTVTLVSGVFSFSGLIVLMTMRPSWATGVVVAALLVIGYALDAADGQLARLRGGGSVSGEWLDHMVDCVKISTLHLAVAISLFRFAALDERWLLVPLGYAVVGAGSFFAQILNEQLQRAHRTAGSIGPTSPSTWVSLLKAPTDYGLLCLIFLLMGSYELFFAAYTVMFVASTGYFLLAAPRWYSQMRDLDREAR